MHRLRRCHSLPGNNRLLFQLLEHSYFTDEDTEAQSDEVTCPRPHDCCGGRCNRGHSAQPDMGSPVLTHKFSPSSHREPQPHLTQGGFTPNTQATLSPSVPAPQAHPRLGGSTWCWETPPPTKCLRCCPLACLGPLGASSQAGTRQREGRG